MKNKQLITLLFLSSSLLLGIWGSLRLVTSNVRAAGLKPLASLPAGDCSALSVGCRPVEIGRAGKLDNHLLPLQLTMTLTSSQDTTLIEDNTGSLSNGAGSSFIVGRTGQSTGSIRRGLIAFDLANSSIPTGSTIISVTLWLHMTRTIAGSQPITLYRVLTGWGEAGSVAPGGGGQGAPAQSGDATWTHAVTNTTPWITPGGDFSPTPSASRLVGDIGFYEWGSTPQLVTDVQGWLDTPVSNFGWLLQGNESSAGTAKNFDTKETSIEANRPVLIIKFEPPVQASYLPMILN